MDGSGAGADPVRGVIQDVLLVRDIAVDILAMAR
jgi:hypothetical protein